MLGRSAILAASFVLLGASQANAQATNASCTSQWLAKRRTLSPAEKFDTKLADAFGKSCLGITGRVPIDWAKARSDLAAAITSADPLVAMTPADISLFCSGYARATPDQRRDFWRALAYAVIKPEAGTNAHAMMWEQPLNRLGEPIDGGEYSVGLLQLSISNRHPYGCDIPAEASLLDPTHNIQCGAKIISYLVTRNGRIGGDADHGRTGLAQYWSTIRVVSAKPRRAGTRDTRTPIILEMRQADACRLPS